MKFQRDKKKDLYIKSQNGRNGVGFQDIVDAIEEGKLLDVIPNPNQKKYPCQEVLVVEINRYAYIVPFNDL